MPVADIAARLAFAHVRASRLVRRHGVQRLARRAANRPRRESCADDIRETVAQDWPRCCGDRVDDASVWIFAGFADDDVIAWLEAGVPRAAAAVRLGAAGVAPRQVSRQYQCDDPFAEGRAGIVTLGLAYTRGDIDLETVLRLRRR